MKFMVLTARNLPGPNVLAWCGLVPSLNSRRAVPQEHGLRTDCRNFMLLAKDGGTDRGHRFPAGADQPFLPNATRYPVDAMMPCRHPDEVTPSDNVWFIYGASRSDRFMWPR